MAGRTVDDRGKGGDQVTGVDDDDVGRQRRDVLALLDEAIAYSLKIRVRELARERGVVGAIARRVDGEVNAGDPTHRGIHAIASISTFTPLRGAAASTVVRAGCTPLKYSRNTRLNASKSFISRRNTPTLTTLASDVPAASRTLLTLSSVTRVCSARSSDMTCLVMGSSGPCPETNTKSPHRTPCAIGDSWPSENPVFGAAFVKTTSGFTRFLP